MAADRLALFSFAARTQPRYLEAFTPAVAIALGSRSPVLVRRARDLFGAYVLLATLAIAMLEGAAETAAAKHGTSAIASRRAARDPGRRATSLRACAHARSGRWPRLVPPALSRRS